MELPPPAPVPSVRDWSDLPLDALILVFARLGAVELLMGAGLVCHSWLEAAKEPELWRKVDMGRGPRDQEVMKNDPGMLEDVHLNLHMHAMVKVAVDRSNGMLEAFVGAVFVTDIVLKYIGDRSPSLKRLALTSCDELASEGFTYLVNKCPLLEDIEVSDCMLVDGAAIVAMGRACRRLGHLKLVHSEFTNKQLMAVVRACRRMWHLSVLNCRNIVVDDALRAKCANIMILELPTSQSRDHHYASDEYYDYESDTPLYLDSSWMADDDGYDYEYGSGAYDFWYSGVLEDCSWMDGCL